MLEINYYIKRCFWSESIFKLLLLFFFRCRPAKIKRRHEALQNLFFFFFNPFILFVLFRLRDKNSSRALHFTAISLIRIQCIFYLIYSLQELFFLGVFFWTDRVCHRNVGPGENPRGWWEAAEWKRRRTQITSDIFPPQPPPPDDLANFVNSVLELKSPSETERSLSSDPDPERRGEM